MQSGEHRQGGRVTLSVRIKYQHLVGRLVGDIQAARAIQREPARRGNPGMRAADDTIGKNVAVLPRGKPLDARLVLGTAGVGDIVGTIELRHDRGWMLDSGVRTFNRVDQDIVKILFAVYADISVLVGNE